MMALAVVIGCVAAATSALAAPGVGAPEWQLQTPGSILLSDPSSGAPIRIWSRFDGLQKKLAWSRFENGRWSEPRVLTFGPGDDLAPAAGSSSSGSFLYWTNERGRVFYAPFDPESGRLFAVPRPLPLTSLRNRGPATEGGGDAPIILGNCDKVHNDPCGGQAPGAPVADPLPSDPAPEGGTDIPILISTSGTNGTSGNSSISNLTVVSSPTCDTQVVSLAGEGVVTVVAVDTGGRVTPLGRVGLDPGADLVEAAAAAGRHFHRRACR